jgi:hypothetical protein
VEYGKKHPNDIPQTWIALKWVMRARFVPSYYARDMINRLQQLKQGAKSVEKYYQELQIGMLRCDLEEREDAAMARFVAGLNREIQDILEYKGYTNITCFILLVKLKGKCRVATQVQRLIFLQEELIHRSTTMYVQPHRLLHQVGWHLLRPATAASLEPLPQIQQVECPQQQRVPLHPPSLLHHQAE